MYVVPKTKVRGISWKMEPSKLVPGWYELKMGGEIWDVIKCDQKPCVDDFDSDILCDWGECDYGKAKVVMVKIVEKK
jgi:hypothetical protein